MRSDRDAGALFYDRGSRLFLMLEDLLGPESVRKALVRFLQLGAGGRATTEDLATAFQEESGYDLGLLDATRESPDGPLFPNPVLARGSR